MKTAFETILKVFVVFLIANLLYVFVMLGYTEYNRPTCLDQGYANIVTVYDFRAYCISGEGIVIPISEVE